MFQEVRELWRCLCTYEGYITYQSSLNHFAIMEVSQSVVNDTEFPPSWEVRPPNGIRVGTNFTDDFKEDIECMFDAGNEYKDFKMSSSRMQERLRIFYPNQFHLYST